MLAWLGLAEYLAYLGIVTLAQFCYGRLLVWLWFVTAELQRRTDDLQALQESGEGPEGP